MMVNLLLKAEASCATSLPDYHPLYLAMASKNMRAVRGIFKFSDALRHIDKFKGANPFLIELARCNSDSVFEECMTEWTKWVRERDPDNYKHLSIKVKDSERHNLLHLIAKNQSVI